MSPRGTSNSNTRGSSASRRARRQWLLDTFGDGTSAPCYRCGETLTDATIQADRIVAGMDGGRYVRGNIRPACSPCNISTGNQLREHRRRFPAGCLVRYRGGRTHWEIESGESELLLVIRSTMSGHRRYAVPRSDLVLAVWP